MMPTGSGPDGTDTARLSALEALREAGAEVDARNGDGYTALHLAALALKPALVTVLLQGGASASNLTASQKTAEECAEQFADKNPEASAQCMPLWYSFHTGSAASADCAPHSPAALSSGCATAA